MFDLVSFILKDCLKQELQGKQVSVIFDGTTRLGEALAIIRFVSHGHWNDLFESSCFPKA